MNAAARATGRRFCVKRGSEERAPSRRRPQAARPKTYEVQSGDTLSSIAKAQFGNADAYQKIFEANRPMLKDPDEIYPGQVLIIPEQTGALA